MTRKRYVKIMLSYGISRNAANKEAMIAQRVGYSYQQFHDEVMMVVLRKD